MHPRVTGVEVLLPYGLRLTFRDGSSGIVDSRRWLHGADGTVFAPLRDPAFAPRSMLTVRRELSPGPTTSISILRRCTSWRTARKLRMRVIARESA
jgi:hypothetical protein